MAVEAAERLLAGHGPRGWKDVRGAAAQYAAVMDPDRPEDGWRIAWIRLSTGEQAFVRLALSLWGAPGVTCSLYRDLGALDDTLRRAVVVAILDAAGYGSGFELDREQYG